MTDDGLPLIGRVPGMAGAYVATGHGPWGMLNAPATGLALAELIVDGRGAVGGPVPLRPRAARRMLNKASIPAAFQQDAKSQRGLGMIHAPNVRLQDAMRQFVIPTYRGRMPSLQVVSSRPVHGLPEAFRLPPSPGEAMAVRLRYAVGGTITASNDATLFAMLAQRQSHSVHGAAAPRGERVPPGRSSSTHAIGAYPTASCSGMYPLLGHTGGSPSSRPSSVTTGPTAQGTTGAPTTRPITPMSVRAAAPAGSAWDPVGR